MLLVIIFIVNALYCMMTYSDIQNDVFSDIRFSWSEI